MKPTTLYRLFDVAGDLLYVGVAGNPGRRFDQHAGDKPWWGDVAHTELEHFANREAALAAERQAIIDEKPTYNIVHSIREADERVVVVTVAERIAMVCSGCGLPVAGGTGYLEVDDQAAYTAMLASKPEPSASLYRRITDLHFVEPQQWVAWHRACDPDPDNNHYWIASDRLSTWSELMEWTAHLTGKNWIEHTNWSAILLAISASSAPLRLSVSRKREAS